MTERHGARAGLRVRQLDGVLADIAPAEIEHFAPAASSERQQPDDGDGLGPLGLAVVERAPEPRQLVGIEEPGDVALWVLPDADTGVGAALAEAAFLGPEHHRAQYLQGAVGRAGLVPARRVEPRGHVLGADLIDRHFAEGGQDAGLEVDADGLAP